MPAGINAAVLPQAAILFCKHPLLRPCRKHTLLLDRWRTQRCHIVDKTHFAEQTCGQPLKQQPYCCFNDDPLLLLSQMSCVAHVNAVVSAAVSNQQTWSCPEDCSLFQQASMLLWCRKLHFSSASTQCACGFETSLEVLTLHGCA